MLKTILNNRYQIIKKLGQGGFGTTYLVTNLQASEETVQVSPFSEATILSSSLCTIKQLNPAHADIETAKKLFKREANILLRLGELSGVPKFIDYFEENNQHYIVEEYIKGKSLDDLLEQKWHSQQIIIFLWDTLSILQKLHQKNIIHRDIKPSNLIQREKDSKYIIIDFGAVKELKQSQLGIQGTRIISIGYAPPEQQRGTPQLNSDIYALGMTAILLLAKIHPKDVIKNKNDDIVWPTNANLNAPKFLTDILNKMVKKKHQERYQSVEEILKAIQGGKEEQKPEEFPPENEVITQEEQNTSNKKPSIIDYLIRPWYIPLLLATIVLIGSEIIHPWIRPIFYLYQGNSLLDKNKANASLSKFQKVIALQRKSAAAWKGRGDALFTLRRYPGALEAYQKAISLEPNNLKALINKGKILYQQGESAKAIKAHQQAIEIDENNADAWSGKGLVHISLQQYEQALKSFDKAQKIKPDEPTIWLQKGIVLKYLEHPDQAQKFYQEALAVYDEKLEKERKNPLLWTDRGFVLLQLNRPQDAFVSYDKALLFDENFYEALLGKANVLNIFQKYEQALEVLDRATEIRPNDYQVWFNRGNLLAHALQRPEPALASFERATQAKADFYPAWLGKGLTLIALKRYEDALQALDTAKNINSQDPFVWLNRGIALEKTGQLTAALESYQKAAIDLQYQPANEYIDKLQQSDAP